MADLESYWSSNYFKYSSTKTEFIWHNGIPPDLKLINDDRLDGSLNYGISLQDEWFLVWCLFELSKKIDCQIQVHDNDGQFLLIEVADHLPKWVTPDRAAGRVWIKGGLLHLIPLESTPSIQGDLPLDTALEILRAGSHPTIAPESINTNLLDRVERASPQALTESHLFNAQAYLHIDIAKSLQSDPNLIGLAVKSFVDKDSDSFKACREMRRFPPQTPYGQQANDPTTYNEASTAWPHVIRMTRPLYAILLNLETTFYPPKPFEKVHWMRVDKENQVEWKRRLLGMKISCGFEMMLSTIDNSEASSVTSSCRRTRRYQSYLDKLGKCGYFQGEVQGSKKWTELESIAERAYHQALKPIDIINRFERALDHCQLPLGLMHIEHDNESDAWLELDEDQLKSVFHETNSDALAATSLHKKEDQSDIDMKNMASFASQMEKFVDGSGALEGAVHSDDEMTDDSNDETSEDPEQEELRADILPSKSRGTKRNYHWASGNPSGKYDDETQKRLATIVPALCSSEWGQSTQQLKRTCNNNDSTTVGPNRSEELRNSRRLPAGAKSKKSLPKFEKQSYDGVSEESSCEDSDSDDLNTPSGMQKRAMAVDTVDDVDMDEEREEFLKFAREALGLTTEQYQAILDTRRERGAYVPPLSSRNEANLQKHGASPLTSSSIVDTKDVESAPSCKGKQPERLVHFDTDVPEDKIDSKSATEKNQTSPVRDMDLDTFDKLMNRMDEELEKQNKNSCQKLKRGGPIPATPLGPNLASSPIISDSQSEDGPENEEEELKMEEVDEAMRRELEDLMSRSGVELDGQPRDGRMSYDAISHFLESFKSQIGSAGPVGNMAGRIGLDLHPPRKGSK